MSSSRTRILTKLAALWAAKPSASFCEIVTDVYGLTNEAWVDDAEWESYLDGELKRADVEIPREGWKS